MFFLQNLSVNQFLWGYKDSFLEAMDTLQTITLQKPMKEFGILMNVSIKIFSKVPQFSIVNELFSF